MMAESRAGQLLLASPSLLDPNFVRSVVLIGVHNEEGAMGVVLNRPSTVTVREAVPQLEPAVDELEPVYVGGPVQPTSVVCLAEFLQPALAEVLVLGRIGFPAPDTGVEELTEATARRLAEDVFRQGRLGDPLPLLDLRLELPLAPAGIAGEHAPPGGRLGQLLDT